MIPDAVREAVDQAKQDAPAFPSHAWPHTVRDVLGTPPQSASGVCIRGYTVAKLHETTYAARVAHGRCKGGSCPACIGFYLADTIARAWQYKFAGAEALYRYVTTYEEFRAERNRVSGHWWVRQADGTLHVFAADSSFPGAVAVAAVPALLDSLLSAPAVMPKKAQGQKAQNRHSPTPKHPEPEQDPEVSVWRVSTGILPQETLQRFSERLSEAGVPVPAWSKRTGSFTYATAVKYVAKLTPAQAEVFRLVYGEYHEQAVNDFWDMLHAVHERRREREWCSAHPLPDNPTAMDLLDAAFDAAESRVRERDERSSPVSVLERHLQTHRVSEENEAGAVDMDALNCDLLGCTLEELRDLQAWEGWVDGVPPHCSNRDPEEEERNQARRKHHERYLQALYTRAWSQARIETGDGRTGDVGACFGEICAVIDELDRLGLTWEAEVEGRAPERLRKRFTLEGMSEWVPTVPNEGNWCPSE